MQIHQGGTGPAVGLPAPSAHLSNPAPAAVRAADSERLVRCVEVVGSPAEELASLAAHLKEVPATRDDVVQHVRERFEQGHYLTREAAERTAVSIGGR